jgi:hypothetical protein
MIRSNRYFNKLVFRHGFQFSVVWYAEWYGGMRAKLIEDLAIVIARCMSMVGRVCKTVNQTNV